MLFPFRNVIISHSEFCEMQTTSAAGHVLGGDLTSDHQRAVLAEWVGIALGIRGRGTFGIISVKRWVDRGI